MATKNPQRTSKKTSSEILETSSISTSKTSSRKSSSKLSAGETSTPEGMNAGDVHSEKSPDLIKNILIPAAGVAFIICIVCIIVYIKRRKRREQKAQGQQEEHVNDTFDTATNHAYENIVAATVSGKAHVQRAEHGIETFDTDIENYNTMEAGTVQPSGSSNGIIELQQAIMDDNQAKETKVTETSPACLKEVKQEINELLKRQHPGLGSNVYTHLTGGTDDDITGKTEYINIGSVCTEARRISYDNNADGKIESNYEDLLLESDDSRIYSVLT